MDLNKLAQYSRQVEAMISAATTADVERALAKLVEGEQWELLGLLLPTATEAAARRIVNELLAQSRYEPLARAACLRRQLRRPGLEAPRAGSAARRVFRDIDEEEDAAGVPEHIMEDMQEMADAAAERRTISHRHAAQVDRDPVRDLIVAQLASRLPEPGPGTALLVIAQACPFDQTRRQAAMKLANHKRWMTELLSAKRTADLIAISESAKLKAVAENVARLLGEQLSELERAGDKAALGFVAEHHPNGEIRQAAHDLCA